MNRCVCLAKRRQITIKSKSVFFSKSCKTRPGVQASKQASKEKRAEAAGRLVIDRVANRYFFSSQIASFSQKSNETEAPSRFTLSPSLIMNLLLGVSHQEGIFKNVD